MKKGTKILIWSLSVIAAAGVGYFIYSRVRLSILNKRVSTLEEVQNDLNNIDISNINIPDDVSTEPDVPLPNPENFSEEAVEQQEEYDTLIVTTNNDAWLMVEPSLDSDLIEIYESGIDMVVLDTSEEYDGLWYNVDAGDNNTGWIIDTDVTPL